MDETFHDSDKNAPVFISDAERNTFLMVNLVVLCNVVSLFGATGNVINIVVFYEQGLNSTINISFFSLAVSDLCSLVFQQFYNMFVNPLFVNLNLPIVYADIQFLTTGVARETFAQITCSITAFITAERCLCVVFPLQVKQIITPKITIIVISLIYITIMIHATLFCITTFLSWKFHPESNSTLLSLTFTSHRVVLEALLYFEHALFTLLAFMSVVTFTLILIYKLRQKNEWRQTANTDQKKPNNLSKRDRATITMVVLIAGILVVCYTPAVLLCLTMFLEPAFSLNGRYYNLYQSLWSLALFLEVVNSSVNIFLYYRMSSKYRRTCKELFSLRRTFS